MNQELKHNTPVDTAQSRYLRGMILKLVHSNFLDQKPHLDLIPLAGALELMRFEPPLNAVVTALQNMKDRGYIDFVQDKNRWTGKVSITRISITPKGIDLIEGNIEPDTAVQID